MAKAGLVAEVILCIALLLAVGFLSTRLASRLRIPHSVFLVLIGIAGGIVLQAGRFTVTRGLAESFPQIVLYVLLPPLIFESAYHLEFRALRKDLLAVSTLATAGLLLSCALIGVGMYALLGIPLAYALVFGALISATDPVAVVALFKELGAPRRLVTLVEAESLMNDGTAIVLFRILVGVAATGTGIAANTVGWGLLQFVGVTGGGIAVGLLCIVLARAALRFTEASAPAQIGLTVTSAYASFVIADHFLHASGVMATMTLGLYLGTRARLELNRDALRVMHALWEFIALSANTLVFLAVGLTVRLDDLQAQAAALPIALIVVYAARALSVAGSLAPLHLIRWIRPIRTDFQAVLMWGGLRGGLAMALLLILPPDFPLKPLLLAMATAVVLASLLVNAVTTAPLLKRLGLHRLSGPEQVFARRSLQEVLDRVFERLQQAAHQGSLQSDLVEEMRTRSFQALAEPREDAATQEAAQFHEAERMMLHEQAYYNEQLELGVLSHPAYAALTLSVQQRLALLRESGFEALGGYDFAIEIRLRGWQRRLGLDAELAELVIRLETLLHLELGLLEARREAPAALAEAWLAGCRARLEEFHAAYPQLEMAVQTRFVADSVAASSRHALAELLEAHAISGRVHAHALDRIGAIHRDLLLAAVRLGAETEA